MQFIRQRSRALLCQLNNQIRQQRRLAVMTAHSAGWAVHSRGRPASTRSRFGSAPMRRDASRRMSFSSVFLPSTRCSSRTCFSAARSCSPEPRPRRRPARLGRVPTRCVHALRAQGGQYEGEQDAQSEACRCQSIENRADATQTPACLSRARINRAGQVLPVPEGNTANQKEHSRPSKYDRLVLAQPYELWDRTHEACQRGTRAEGDEDCR